MARATYTLTIINGAVGPDTNGQELAEWLIDHPGREVDWHTLQWMLASGYDDDHPGYRVVITPDGENPAAANVVASRTVTL